MNMYSNNSKYKRCVLIKNITSIILLCILIIGIIVYTQNIPKLEQNSEALTNTKKGIEIDALYSIRKSEIEQNNVLENINNDTTKENNALTAQQNASDGATDIIEENQTIDISQPTSSNEYYDVPLTYEEQDYLMSLCEQYNVEYSLILAMMQVESGFNSGAISSTNDYGIMQINICNHEWLKSTLGVSDMLSFYDNSLCGVYMISLHINKYNNTHMALMAYNMGEGGAQSYWNNGVYTSSYSCKIIDAQNNLKKI